ncbi:hypothetical protein [uncultured Propionibacterium sp.]|uniref:hypothetical protein n=1 Tax=uncultured Propionibacterium sp. TaxID=218066 RepID=UPI00292EF0C1|nr:hypothetical protein [uncultured Propionibacterium sp.]
MPSSPERTRPRNRTIGTLLKMREPIAWLVVAVTVVYIVLGGVRLGWNVAHESMGVSASARQTGASVPLIWVLVDVAMVLVCVFVRGTIGRARALTRTTAVVVSVAACYDVFILVVGVLGADASVFSRVLETIGGLLEVAAKIAAAVVLWRLVPARAERAGQAIPAAQARGAVWTPEQAVGRTWSRAGDAVPAGQQGFVSGPARGGQAGPAPVRGSATPSRPWLTAGQLAAGRKQASAPPQGSEGGNPLRAEEGPSGHRKDP